MFKRILNFYLALMMGFMLLVGHASFVYADSEIKVIVDGRQISFDQPPINENGRVMVPIRFVAEAMGWEVWEVADHLIGAHKIANGYNYVSFIDIKDCMVLNEITVYKASLDDALQGLNVKMKESKPMEVMPKIVNGRTLVGIRDLAEALFAEVDWNDNTKSVIITSQPLPFAESSEVFETAESVNMETMTEVQQVQTQKELEINVAQQVVEFEQELIKLVNAERVAAGLKEVAINYDLMAVARWKAEDMNEMDYFSHTNSLGLSNTEIVQRFGIECVGVSENIIDSPGIVIHPYNAMYDYYGWMNSVGHKANILKEIATEIGVGYCNGYWCLMMMW